MLSKFKMFFSNKDGKSIVENFLSLSVLQLVGVIFPFVTLPYLIRVLGFTNYGICVMAVSLVSFFIPIVDYSFRVTAVRDVALHRDSIAKLNLIYNKVMTIKLLFLILSIIVIFLIVLVYPPFYKEKTVFFYHLWNGYWKFFIS